MPYFTATSPTSCPNSPPVTKVGIKLPPGKPEDTEHTENPKCNSMTASTHIISVLPFCACCSKNCSPPPVRFTCINEIM